MSKPKAYEPAQGYMYQLFTRSVDDRVWEHCDYAVDRKDKNYLLGEYRLAYGNGFAFKSIELPRKYWNKIV